MPRIILKPNSAEYEDPHKREAQLRFCEMPGCRSEATHKAPKDRSLSAHYHFCFDHVREYNAAWDFFSGMSEHDIQDHIKSTFYGERPTWRYDGFKNAEEDLRDKAESFRGNQEDAEARTDSRASDDNRQQQNFFPQTQEFEALAIMGLSPPVDLNKIKTRYKELAKKHHPDLNKGCAKSEETLKKINMAYTILKLAYQKYEKILD